GSPASSSAQNPTVAYSTAGTYSVSLTATNADGSDSKTVSSYITVTD
ncbi:MAG TPA: surface layer protein B, partial [Cytophagales bacterium]|nr:surface layer protein B [Cytophagales bacterium]